jgi:hypothetical protein
MRKDINIWKKDSSRPKKELLLVLNVSRCFSYKLLSFSVYNKVKTFWKNIICWKFLLYHEGISSHVHCLMSNLCVAILL